MSSPITYQVFSQENPDNVIRKPEINAISRRPFTDRPVNASPATSESLNMECSLKHDAEENDLIHYDTYSYLDIKENFFDMCFNPPSKKDTYHILSSYTGYPATRTPPPELSPLPSMFIKVPEMKILKNASKDSTRKLLKPVDDVSLPDINLHCFAV